MQGYKACQKESFDNFRLKQMIPSNHLGSVASVK